MKSNPYPLFFAVFLILPATTASAQTLRDGRLYDQGRQMENRSPRAPEALDEMKQIIGQWDVTVTTYPTDSTSYTASGMADIAYMNRGYAYMVRVHVPAFDEAGNEANTLGFLVFHPASENWALGEANSYTENISMYNGGFDRQQLVLTTAVRRRGGVLLTYYRLTYDLTSADAFTVAMHASTDAGVNWNPIKEQRFVRRTPHPDFMKTRDDAGAPSPDRPQESEAFDFLLGSWNASHNILLNGQWVQFPANATAVYAMNGHAILEHNWYDVDPNLPDAATSIIRLYNRSMRRWESLYITNRANAPLFFGGSKDGERMVLHQFEVHTADPSFPRYVFHDIGPDAYGWFAESSTDRGKTFNKTWTIAFRRE